MSELSDDNASIKCVLDMKQNDRKDQEIKQSCSQKHGQNRSQT